MFLICTSIPLEKNLEYKWHLTWRVGKLKTGKTLTQEEGAAVAPGFHYRKFESETQVGKRK